MNNYFFNTYGYEPSKGWVGYKKQLNEQGVATDYHDEFGKRYVPGSAIPSPTPTPNEHEYVDLGLPSGTLWATENIKDANGNELYFAWGETQGYTAEQVGTDKNFTWEDYQWGNPDSGTLVTDALIDENNNLKPEYDAATANWGDGWRMPTKAEFEELMTLPHTWDSSRSGYSFTDANDNELLFVFAGGSADDGNVRNLGNNGRYWSGSLSDGKYVDAWELNFGSDKYSIGVNRRYFGRTVRPVKVSN